MNTCRNCGKEIPKNRKYCSPKCYRTSYEFVKRITNLGIKTAKKRKGKTIDEIYGKEKADYLRRTQYKKCGRHARKRLKGKTKEELYGKKKAEEIIKKSLKTRGVLQTYEDKLPKAKKTVDFVKINSNPEKVKKIKHSFKIHDKKVEELYDVLKTSKKKRVLNVSSRQRDFMPDIIMVDKNENLGSSWKKK